MALIEGVGDEVTLLFGVLLLLLILLLAWISTSTSEPPEHLFVSATRPTPLLGSSPAQGDSPLSSADTSSQSASSSSTNSVGESSQTEVASRTASSQEAKDEEGGRAEALGEGLRRRDGGGGGGGEEGESSSSQRNMVVRLKFLNDTERTAQVKPQDTIGYIKRCVTYMHTRLHNACNVVLTCAYVFQDLFCRPGAAGATYLPGSVAAG